MLGLNLKLPAEQGDGKHLKVHSIFYTIQGEGPFIGQRATFIRLSGCNLACDFCDTDFDDYVLQSVDDIVAIVQSHKIGGLVVITGGEPFRQNINVLCQALCTKGYQVQIETNGILYRHIPKEVSIVCSPKAVNGKYYSIREDVLQQTIAIKFVISKSKIGYQHISEVGQSQFNIPVYIQPMDEQDQLLNKENINYAIHLAKQKNVLLGVQMHKYYSIQ